MCCDCWFSKQSLNRQDKQCQYNNRKFRNNTRFVFLCTAVRCSELFKYASVIQRFPLRHVSPYIMRADSNNVNRVPYARIPRFNIINTDGEGFISRAEKIKNKKSIVQCPRRRQYFTLPVPGPFAPRITVVYQLRTLLMEISCTRVRRTPPRPRYTTTCVFVVAFGPQKHLRVRWAAAVKSRRVVSRIPQTHIINARVQCPHGFRAAQSARYNVIRNVHY